MTLAVALTRFGAEAAWRQRRADLIALVLKHPDFQPCSNPGCMCNDQRQLLEHCRLCTKKPRAGICDYAGCPSLRQLAEHVKHCQVNLVLIITQIVIPQYLTLFFRTRIALCAHLPSSRQQQQLRQEE